MMDMMSNVGLNFNSPSTTRVIFKSRLWTGNFTFDGHSSCSGELPFLVTGHVMVVILKYFLFLQKNVTPHRNGR